MPRRASAKTEHSLCRDAARNSRSEPAALSSFRICRLDSNGSYIGSVTAASIGTIVGRRRRLGANRSPVQPRSRANGSILVECRASMRSCSLGLGRRRFDQDCPPSRREARRSKARLAAHPSLAIVLGWRRNVSDSDPDVRLFRGSIASPSFPWFRPSPRGEFSRRFSEPVDYAVIRVCFSAIEPPRVKQDRTPPGSEPIVASISPLRSRFMGGVRGSIANCAAP